MHRRDLLRAIARTTGDTISTIKRLGFDLEATSQKEIRKAVSNDNPFTDSIDVTSKQYPHQWENTD